MKPNEWLELVTAHASDPDKINDENMALLRSNYVVWKAALEMLRSENKNSLIKETQRILNGAILPPEDYEMLKQGVHKPDTLTSEQWEELRVVRVQYIDWNSKLISAGTALSFYKKFDTEFKDTNGVDCPEVAEVYWKQRAANLEGAIQKHRQAYVLANKQPNGIDFLLWQEINEDEFHASRHAAIQNGGRLSFKE